MKSNQEKHINNHNDNKSIRSNDLNGGNNKFKGNFGNLKNESNFIIEQKNIICPKGARRVENSVVETKSFDVGRFGKPRIVESGEYETVNELMIACKHWWVKRYRKDPDTWRSYNNLLVDMANHKIFPVDLFKPDPNQIIAQLDYIEDELISNRTDDDPNEGIFAVINRHKAIRALMRAYGRISEVNNWNYTPPNTPKPKPKPIPSPDVVYKFMHNRYSTDRYESALYQYLFTLGFFIGPRPASELSAMKIDDIDLDSGMFTFYQPKVSCWREVPMEKELVKYGNRKSMKNWVNNWRPKAVSQYSGNYLFIQPDGKPFSEAFMAKKLRKMGIPVWDKFYPYCMRHWCATSRLIGWKVRTGVFATKEICDYMQHSSENVTKSYIRQASKWFRIAPFDWISSLLKYHSQTVEKLMQEKGLNREKSEKAQNRWLPMQIPPRKWYGPAGI